MNELTKVASILPSLTGELASMLSPGGIRSDDWNVHGYKDWRDTRVSSYYYIQSAADLVVKRDIDHGWTAETLLNATLSVLATGGRKPDPVIVYLIACCDKIEAIKTNYEQSAVTAFKEEGDFYKRLLGNLLPTKLAEIHATDNARRAYRTGTHATAAQDWAVYGEILGAQCAQPLQGLATGLSALDGALGGMSGLTLLAGPPGGGKTSLALKFMTAALHHHPDVAALYVQLDSGMTRTVMYHRLLCEAAKVPYRTLMVRPYAADVLERLEAANTNLWQTVLPRLRIVGRPHTDPPEEPESIDARFLRKCCNALLRTTGVSRIMIVMDYLGLMDAPPEMSPTSLDADDYRIGQIYEARRDTDDTYLVITEVTKAAGEVLTGADIKGSISKQYGADRILLLEPDRYSDSRGPKVGANLRIVKSRDGTDRITIPLTFDISNYTFTEVAQTPVSAPRAQVKHGGAGKIDPMAGLDED